MDKNDPVLGFFHYWVENLAQKFNKISVVCLEKGDFNLPQNVKVYSLGKESIKSKLKYITNFYCYILGLHAEYDVVFVHMNQEYVLLGGFFWKILGKPVYMWRNHPQGNILTKISVWLSKKVFCTSNFAYVAKYKKTQIMPVGIDTSIFNTESRIKNYESCTNKILFLSRISPIKKPDLLIEALKILKEKNINFTCDFYGNALPKDQNYFNEIKTKVKDLNLENQIKFFEAVPNHETPKIYQNYEIFINLTPTGSFDKTILEAAACGCIPVVLNKSLKGEINDQMIIEEENSESVAKSIVFWLNKEATEKNAASRILQEYVKQKHSLDKLIKKLCEETKK